MTEGDLDRIEQSLGIVLPASYRERLTHFPIPAAAGNADFEIWDDAARLIALNRDLRKGGIFASWPRRYFALGQTDDGCQHALDLEAGDAVLWVDRGHLDQAVPAASHFGPWADESLATLREEMRESADPDGTPEARKAAESKFHWSDLGTVLGWLLFLTVVASSTTAARAQ